MFMFPIIHTQRLFLRQLTIDDAANLALVLSNKESMKHYPHEFSSKEVISCIEQNINRYKNDGFGLWAVIRKSDGQFLGDCGITLKNIAGEILPEIGYHIIQAYCKMGYASEAAEACKKYAIEVLGFTSIYSYSEIGNIASQRVAQKIGMRKVKTFEIDGISEVVYQYP